MSLIAPLPATSAGPLVAPPAPPPRARRPRGRRRVIVVRELEIERPVEAVFAFVADARNDPRWCRKVLRVEQVEGSAPGPGAVYAVTHRPVPFRPVRELRLSCLGWDPPYSIDWREEDGVDAIDVRYELERVAGGSTRLRQRDRAELGAPRALHPFLRVGIGRDVARQLRTLRTVLR